MEADYGVVLYLPGEQRMFIIPGEKSGIFLSKPAPHFPVTDAGGDLESSVGYRLNWPYQTTR